MILVQFSPSCCLTSLRSGQNFYTPVLLLLKGYFTSGKMNVYIKWGIYVEEI